MKRSWVLLLTGVASIAWAAPASAHPHEYPPYQVTFAPGHVVPDSAGLATFSIIDMFLSPVSGLVCQDNNADGLCGGPGDFAVRFCGSVVVAMTQLIDPALPLHVIVDTPLTANPIGDECWFGTAGEIGHS